MPSIEDDDDRPRSRDRGSNDDADDDRPRRRKRRDDDDDYDDGPRKKKSGGGGMVAIIIIVVVVVILGCGGLVAIGLLLPAVTKVREAAARMNELNNMKQVSLGVLNYQSQNGKFPEAEKNLSWRVEILPYLEQENLFRKFDPNQPWNAGPNQPMADVAIKTYISPLDEPGTVQTHYRVFTGTDTAFDPNLMRQRPYPTCFMDGASNTLLAVDTAETIPWPQPKEIPFTPNGSFPELGNAKRAQGLAALCDGSVKAFEKKAMNDNLLRSLVTANGGEAFGDW